MFEENIKNYYLKLPNFQGPFDLLLHMVKNSLVQVDELSISEITGQFLEFIKNWRELKIELTSEFVFFTSNLLYLKSRALLPQDIYLYNNNDDEQNQESRRQLVERIIEYQKYKNAAQMLENCFKYDKVLIRKEGQPVNCEDGREWEEVSISDLIKAFSNLARKSDVSIFKNLGRKQLSLDEKINQILEYLIDNQELMFWALFPDNYSRYELIISFLALLELVKMKKIYILQNRLFGDIKIIKRN